MGDQVLIRLAILTMFGTVIEGIRNPNLPLLGIDIGLVIAAALLTTLGSMKSWADAIEASHLVPVGREEDAGRRLLLELLSHFLLITCLFMAAATAVAIARMALSMNVGNLAASVIHGGLTLAAWMGCKRVGRLVK